MVDLTFLVGFFTISYYYGHREQFKIICDIHQYNTRNKNKLRLQTSCFRSSSKKNWLNISTELFNSVPSAVKSLPSKSFKRMYLCLNASVVLMNFFILIGDCIQCNIFQLIIQVIVIFLDL